MNDRPEIPLEYSSIAEEEKREAERERQRREALGNYNEATYDERHPYSGAFLWVAIVAVVSILISLGFREWLGSSLGRFGTFIVTLGVTCTLLIFKRLRDR